MKLSLSVLVATLGVSQFSGVFGAEDSKEEKVQLRRNLRKGESTQRKTQFVWTDDDPDIDDLFSVPETIENVGPNQDNFFVETESGMVYDWGALMEDTEHTHEHVHESAVDESAVDESAVDHTHEHGHPHTHVDYYDYYSGKSGKVSKKFGTGTRVAGNQKLAKAAKVGKVMWEETPVYAKSAKKAKKGAKALKATFSKGAKDGFVMSKARTSYYYDSIDYYSSHSHEERMVDGHHEEDHEHHDTEDGWMSAFGSSTSTSNGGYSDLFTNNQQGVVATRAEENNYFGERGDSVVSAQKFQANGGSNLISPRMSDGGDNPSSRHYTFDDDFFNEDERLVFLPRPVVTLAGSVFSSNPQSIIPPVVPDGSGNTLTVGTEYMFNEVLTDAQNIGSAIVPVGVDAEQVLFVVALDGYCDRIGPADQNSVQGYCFFTYTFIDPSSQLTAGSFTAQGIIVNAEVPGQLTISGGTGVMTGATGLVEILPAAIDDQINPPLLIQPPTGSDPFNGVAGWAHFFEFQVDVLFFLPELYS